MKTVFLLFDSLNRRMLSAYGGTYLQTPNFSRLKKKSITFNNHFVGSMPCMPARRDLHSGRLSFLHRSWGPLEPFDNSFAEILKKNDVYTHLITDHYHYFEDGGATYHNRFKSFDFIRGQESDPWKAMVQPPLEKFKKKFHKITIDQTKVNSNKLFYQINSEYIKEEKDFPSVKCFQSGLEFLETNNNSDNWFLQLETFDPHEPFFAPKKFREKFKTNYRGPRLDWPPYDKVSESSDEIEEIKANYLALVSLCDSLLGLILDFFDKENLWKDTALILTTDHGFMLGEHDWWAKTRMPMFNEIAHIPLFIYHPDFKDKGGQSRDAVTQNIDLMPTFLEINNSEIPKEVQGKSLLPIMTNDNPNIISSALYGYWGGGINITDGRYTYFHYPNNYEDYSPNQYTLMPTHMRQFFSLLELQEMNLQKPFSFTKDIPVLKIQSLENQKIKYADVKNYLFDIKNDPGQLNPINDDKIIEEMKNLIIKKIHENDAPKEIYDKYFL